MSYFALPLRWRVYHFRGDSLHHRVQPLLSLRPSYAGLGVEFLIAIVGSSLYAKCAGLLCIMQMCAIGFAVAALMG